MSLQINAPLTTQQGFAVPAGSYVWILADLGNDMKYEVRVSLIFFKDKASFDLKRSRFNPVEIPDDKQCYIKALSIAAFSGLDMLAIHNFIKADLEALPAIGAGAVAIVA